MSPELVFWLALTIKMAVTALSVSVATIIAERLGAVAGALVATLPVSAGPVYVFLALDHGAAFISFLTDRSAREDLVSLTLSVAARHKALGVTVGADEAHAWYVTNLHGVTYH